MKKIQIKWEVVITIVISITGLFISWQAYKISKLQAEIARNSLLPNIQVNEIYGAMESVNVNDYIIEITNLEGKINNYNSKIVSFLDCQYIDKAYHFYDEKVPILYYYMWHENSKSNIGVLERIATAFNYKRLEKLENDIAKYIKYTEEVLNIELESYLKIEYVDLLGKQQELYYYINKGQASIVESQKAIEKFNEHRRLSEKNIGINPNNGDITVQELISQICEISQLDDVTVNIMNEEESQTDYTMIWNIFVDVVIPIITAVSAVYIAEYFARKRDHKQKRIEIQIEYLKKEIEYLKKWKREYLICQERSISV